MPPFDLDGEPASLLYLINLTAGLHGRRRPPRSRSRRGPGTRAVVTGQSATRVHPALASYATQQWAVDGRGRRLPGRPARPDDPVPGQPLLPARPGRARPARPADLGRHLAARPLRPRRALRAVPVRADRPGLRGPPRRPAGLPRPLPLGRPLDRRGRRLVLRRGAGRPPACSWPGRCPESLPEAGPALRRSVFRLDDGETCMRWCGPPAAVTADLVRHRPAPGRELDRRARGPPLAPRLERPRPQPLVLDLPRIEPGEDTSCSG